MSRVVSLLIVVPLWFAAMIYLALVQTVRYEDQSINDWIIKMTVNNCTDSAIEELLDASDLGMDYNDWGNFNTDPELALNDFVDMFLLSYGIPLTETAREDVKANYIQAFCVAGYDGYYIYDHRETSPGNGFDLVGSP